MPPWIESLPQPPYRMSFSNFVWNTGPGGALAAGGVAVKRAVNLSEPFRLISACWMFPGVVISDWTAAAVTPYSGSVNPSRLSNPRPSPPRMKESPRPPDTQSLP